MQWFRIDLINTLNCFIFCNKIHFIFKTCIFIKGAQKLCRGFVRILLECHFYSLHHSMVIVLVAVGSDHLDLIPPLRITFRIWISTLISNYLKIINTIYINHEKQCIRSHQCEQQYSRFCLLLIGSARAHKSCTLTCIKLVSVNRTSIKYKQTKTKLKHWTQTKEDARVIIIGGNTARPTRMFIQQFCIIVRKTKEEEQR